MRFDQHDEAWLGTAMHTEHRDFVNRCLANGHLLPWMDIETILDRDELALLQHIANAGPVAWSGMLGAERRSLAMTLWFQSVGNLKATVNKSQSRGLTQHSIRDGVEWIGIALYGRWLMDIVEADDGIE